MCVCVLGVAKKGAEKEVKEKRIDRQTRREKGCKFWRGEEKGRGGRKGDE